MKKQFLLVNLLVAILMGFGVKAETPKNVSISTACVAGTSENIAVNGVFPIPALSEWKYNDTGVDLGTTWKDVAFDDTAWASGNGIFGYGDGVETTTLNFGPDANNKYPTYYFRNTFDIADASQFLDLIFDVRRDDGVVVYVNGTEAFRMNMPSGPITYNTYASSTVGGSNETTYFQEVTANLLQNGTNVIAVELHQASANSSDLGFDMAVSSTEVLPPLEPTPFPVAKDSRWKYLDNGTSLDGENWTELAYDNSSWANGHGTLGYGDPVNTLISFGPNSNDKYITYYFSKDIEVDLANVSEFVEFGLKRDDGAIVYVNGVEVFRDNMPEEPTDYLTHSSTIIDGINENIYFTQQVPKSVLVNGINRISVEIHNRDGQSSDLRFDMYIKNYEDLSVECADEHIGCFTSIVPTGQTSNMIIPQEHNFQQILKQGSAYTIGGGTVPGNHDFTGYIGNAGSSELGYLSVNHENSPGGVSMVNLHLDNATNLWVLDDTQAVDFYNNALVTTIRNCSGGISPWGTAITAEENTSGGDANGDGYQDVGWLVEIDPVTAQVMDYGNGQEKLWAMGRMNHENVVVSADGTTAYYGEDGGTDCVYKFVADTPGDLTSGTVYVLKLDLPLSGNDPSSSTATWIQVPNTTKADRNNISSVAGALGGTNFNGVEDCEINPITGKIYFTAKGKDRVYRFKDDGNTISEFETFVGGKSYDINTDQGVFTEAWSDGNDNLTFDDKGNLWVLQDGGRNYIWVVRPDHTQSNPKVLLHSSMPAGSEPTGLTFTPDYKYGFFSVQHPSGGNSPQQDATLNDVTFNASATVVFALRTEIGIQAPIADFEANNTIITEGETVTFTDLSENTPDAWNWTFEGGIPETSTDQSPVVTYNTPGTFDVTLVVSNIAGTSDAQIKTEYITVDQDPLSDFEANDLLITEGETVTFTDLSGNTADSWLWTFEGGTPATSTDPSPVVTYNTPGEYDVTLEISNLAGASDSEMKTDYIRVAEMPVAAFEADRVFVSEGESVTFTDLSQNNTNSWFWTFEGGTPATSSDESPVVTYNTAGVYDVSLEVLNIAGTSATEVKSQYITVEMLVGIDENDALQNLSLYPNPTKGDITLELNSADAGKTVKIEVYDLLGRSLYSTNAETTGGNQKIELDLSSFTASNNVLIMNIEIDGKMGQFKILTSK
ncbi:alkaline phosphatase PhoX [Aequorivita vladivostokensis]|uniref:alkaline phosphatase PhoX n=1 Tax=Aequorivita vladivostokensis TaxID=171194 RepID=UPI0006977A8E|nr:alkaline phosphatase PhoX [Aequorivita vladivostokensis]